MKDLNHILAKQDDIHQEIIEKGFKNPRLFKHDAQDYKNTVCLLVERDKPINAVIDRISAERALEQKLGCKVIIEISNDLADFIKNTYLENSVLLDDEAALRRKFENEEFLEVQDRNNQGGTNSDNNNALSTSQQLSRSMKFLQQDQQSDSFAQTTKKRKLEQIKQLEEELETTAPADIDNVITKLAEKVRTNNSL